MASWHPFKPVLRIAGFFLVLYLSVVVIVYFWQRSLLYFPSHSAPGSGLSTWIEDGRVIGYCRIVPHPDTIWLMMHGNAGQAADRDYVLPRMSGRDSLYVLEYPGYGLRAGNPTLKSMNQAAAEAYHFLRSQNPTTPVCVLGESIGSGPACSLAGEKPPPDKIVLVVPFDSMAKVAARHYPFLPVKFMLHDNWDNVESLRHYGGPVEIFGARDDVIIPVEHAKALARQIPSAHFTEIPGGHNDWSISDEVKIRR
jgi:hypothetical protein